MKCSICGNEKDFIVVLTTQEVVKHIKDNSYRVIESKNIGSVWCCNSEQCKGKNVVVVDHKEEGNETEREKSCKDKEGKQS